MIYPSLVPDMVCKTDIHIYIESENISEDGAPICLFDKDLKCFYQGKARKVLTSNKESIQLSGRVYFNGDIFPDIPEISGGEVTIFGERRGIYQGFKARNPDGTVNYTRLDII